jgi:hypothetical protein
MEKHTRVVLIVASFAVALVVFRDSAEVPNRIVLDAECAVPSRYWVSERFNAEAFWKSQQGAMREERRIEGSRKQFKAELDRLTAEIKVRQPSQGPRIFEEDCPELTRRANARYNMQYDPADCPKVTPEVLERKKMLQEVDSIRREARNKEDAVTSAYHEAWLDRRWQERLAWLDYCESTIIGKLQAAQLRR